MKLARISNVLRLLKSSSVHGDGFKCVSGISFYSTFKERRSEYELFGRLSRLGDPTHSMVPVLDQWVQEGRPVVREQLHRIVKKFREFGRFKHALEISTWMSDKRYMEITVRDIDLRLDLIYEVHGITQAERYFEAIPVKLRKVVAYNSLLNCYVRSVSVDKAEAAMQSMRDLGLARFPYCYNLMLRLYLETGDHEKAARVLSEMEEKGIKNDYYTSSIRLSACATASDIDGMEKILIQMENDPAAALKWSNYSVAANGYIRAGLIDKALVVLKKAESLMFTEKKQKEGYQYLLTQYAAAGRKDELLRLWEDYKKNEKVYNKGYICVITSILKFDDVEWAEMVFEEWESSTLRFDIRIPNYLISAYCRKGLFDKAENLLNKIILDGNEPDHCSWYYLASGYLQNHQNQKTVEAMKKCLSVCRGKWKPDQEILTACLEYLNDKGDDKEAEEFVSLLKAKDIACSDSYSR